MAVKPNVKPIPDGYHSITPYFVIKDAERFIKFLKEAFGGTEAGVFKTPDGTIMHAEVQIGDSKVMLAEASEKYPARTEMIFLYDKDVDGTYKKALKAGATSDMEPADQFYGDRSCTVTDPFGNIWTVSTHIRDVSMEEMEKHMKEQQPT